MSQIILIYGESGTGKSTAIRTLNPEETFIINVLGKPLPFKGWRNHYTLKTKENAGNMLVTDKAKTMNKENIGIIDILNAISQKMPNIKNVVIDDFQYVMANEFMYRAGESGWQKFTDIGQNAWSIITQASSLNDTLKVFFLAHADTNDATGKTKVKTIGRMLDEKVCLEGMFTIVLYSTIIDGRYVFITQNTGNIVAKSPHLMFADKVIDNDLDFIVKKINEYEIEEDVKQ